MCISRTGALCLKESDSGRLRPFGGRQTVLLIEDNQSIERLITLILGGGGYGVITARNGAAALETLADEMPDLILCDIELPDINGFEILRRIRADRRLKAIPVVAFTVMVLQEDLDRMRAAGFAGTIAKPIHPDTFLADIASFLTD